MDTTNQGVKIVAAKYLPQSRSQVMMGALNAGVFCCKSLFVSMMR